MSTLTRFNADFIALVTSSVQRQQQFPVPFPGLSSEEMHDLCFSLSHGFITRQVYIIKTQMLHFWETVTLFMVSVMFSVIQIRSIFLTVGQFLTSWSCGQTEQSCS